jgi:hypothetical protein
MRKNDKIRLIFKAVETVTGVNRQTIASQSWTRTREIYFARIITTHHLSEYGLSAPNICSLVGVKSKKALQHQLQVYLNERTPYFISRAVEVERILSQHKS